MNASFWARLDREARPHIEQQLARLGWVLREGSGHVWRAARVRRSGKAADPRDTIQRVDAAGLLEAVEKREREITQQREGRGATA